MSAHTLTPSHGATASGVGAFPHQSYRVGGALRAVRVFVATAFDVAVLGEYAEEAGVRVRNAVPAPRTPRTPRAPHGG
ncbi:hypothetical protein [Streptomyces sp. DW26H14]|uniref:hypothetical protein n=1 Tax=Streptomyces sp. DW26H14 TaxID=3435395 RepID=UPI00403D6193